MNHEQKWMMSWYKRCLLGAHLEKSYRCKLMIHNNPIVLIRSKLKRNVQPLYPLVTLKFYISSLTASSKKGDRNNIGFGAVEHCIILVECVPFFIIRWAFEIVNYICFIQVKVFDAACKIFRDD